MRIISTAFNDGGDIPVKYTCDGENISPDLSWEEIPAETDSLAIICDDPDAPSKVWTHWIVFNLPAHLEGIAEAVSADSLTAMGAGQGLNDSGKIGYRGPCPPGGVHRYFFKLYALDINLDLRLGTTKEELLSFMEGHILEKSEIIGLYAR